MKEVSPVQPSPAQPATDLAPPEPRWPSTSEWERALRTAQRLAVTHLGKVTEPPVTRHAQPDTLLPRFDFPLPESGCPPDAALDEWFHLTEPGIVRSPGPRCFGFVTGGSTPAALAGDWLASALDQNAATWLLSPAAAATARAAARRLLDLFDLPAGWSGALSTGAAVANLSGLAAGRQ